MFTPIKHTTVSEKVIEQIKEMVSKGDLKKVINFHQKEKWQKIYKSVELL